MTAIDLKSYEGQNLNMTQFLWEYVEIFALPWRFGEKIVPKLKCVYKVYKEWMWVFSTCGRNFGQYYVWESGIVFVDHKYIMILLSTCFDSNVWLLLLFFIEKVTIIQMA